MSETSTEQRLKLTLSGSLFYFLLRRQKKVALPDSLHVLSLCFSQFLVTVLSSQVLMRLRSAC